MSYSVLVVEDDAGIRLGLEDSLRIAGYEVHTAGDGAAGLDRALQGGLDAIVLDLMLPVMDGLDLCTELRKKGVDTPVLMLTAKTELGDILRGFSVGADDYLTKPFEALELLARIRAVLHRSCPPIDEKAAQRRVIGGLSLDTRNGFVWRDGQAVELSATERALLRYFVAHPDQTLTRNRILRDVWNSRLSESTRTVDAHVASLRRKLGDNPDRPRWIRTVFGEGYEFVPD